MKKLINYIIKKIIFSVMIITFSLSYCSLVQAAVCPSKDGDFLYYNSPKYSYLSTDGGCAQIFRYTGDGGVVTIPNKLGGFSVASILDGAFNGCKGLTGISIPRDVTSIGNESFSDCSDLTSIIIPQGVSSIGEKAFSGCTNLNSITFNSATTKIYDISDGEYTIPATTTIIGYDPSTAKDYAAKYNRLFEVIGTKNHLQSIAITTPSNKLRYYIGDKLDITGLGITGTYSDGSSKTLNIDSTNITGFDSTVETDKQVLTISVGNKTTTYNIQIVPLPNAFTATEVFTDRLFDNDRNGTAVNIADKFTSATTAVLAPSSDANLMDALAAAPLAGKFSPILLTDSKNLSDATKVELIKLKVTNVYVVGAISQAVVDQVNAIHGVTATPLMGSDRIGTAAAINAKLTSPAGSFVVGYNALADALSVASYAAANNYSIIIANPDGSLPNKESLPSTNVYIIGGPTLVQNIAGANRLAGADRFVTNKVVLDTLDYTYKQVFVANGTDPHLVDSLVASSLAASSGAPIILTDPVGGGDATANEIRTSKLVDKAEIVALGGDSVVSAATLAKFYDTSLPNLTIRSVNPIEITTAAGIAPVLPATVIASMSDGTDRMVNVNWPNISTSQYSNAETFKVSGTIANTTVTAVANITVHAAISVIICPSLVNSCIGGSQNIILTALDTNSKPVPNCAIYLKPNISGLWITQVNGNIITSSVNMGTSSSISNQTVNTPIPLFNVFPYSPAYDSVAATGIEADYLQTSPVVKLVTGDDGTVTLTLVDGNVTYATNFVPTATNNTYTVDPGKSINQQKLFFYSDLDQTQNLGYIILNWAGAA